MVPRARAFPAGCVLPKALLLGPDGEVIEGDVLERFAALGAVAERIWPVLRVELGWAAPEDDFRGIERAEAWALALRALGINYRIGGHEASLLALLTTENISAVLSAIVDGPEIEARAKKKAASTPDGSASDDGSTDG